MDLGDSRFDLLPYAWNVAAVAFAVHASDREVIWKHEIMLMTDCNDQRMSRKVASSMYPNCVPRASFKKSASVRGESEVKVQVNHLALTKS
jgi:hypothetical protein